MLAAEAVQKEVGVRGYSASVRFCGPLVGEVVVRLPESVLREAATNMMGECPDAGSPPLDVLGEIANVICGQTLTLLGGTGVVFQMEPPRSSTELTTLEGGDDAIVVDIGGAAASVAIRCAVAARAAVPS